MAIGLQGFERTNSNNDWRVLFASWKSLRESNWRDRRSRARATLRSHGHSVLFKSVHTWSSPCCMIGRYYCEKYYLLPITERIGNIDRPIRRELF